MTHYRVIVSVDKPRRQSVRSIWMVSRIAIVGAVITVLVMWLGSFPVSSWAVIAFLIVLFPVVIVLTMERMRVESRFARTIWQALTRK